MGLTLAFLIAVIEGYKNVLLKQGTKSLTPLALAWAWQVFSLIILLPVLVFIPWPSLNGTFWVAMSLKTVLYMISLYFYSKALTEADVSLAMPMLAVSPLVVGVVSFFMNGEVPTTLGWTGILLLLSGIYWLNLKSRTDHPLQPFVEIWRNVGVRSMTVVAIIWGFTGSLDKLAVTNSSPLFYTSLVAVATSMLLGAVVWLVEPTVVKKLFKLGTTRQLAPIGVLDGLIGLMQMTAISLTLTVYVISIKRTSIIFAGILAYVLLGEQSLKRLAPIVVVVMGLILVLVS